jgi:hypothetical protein
VCQARRRGPGLTRAPLAPANSCTYHCTMEEVLRLSISEARARLPELAQLDWSWP